MMEEPDVHAIREKYDMTQQEFSSLLWISVGTLRNWEQGSRKPQGSAKVLLKICGKAAKSNIGIFNVNYPANHRQIKRTRKRLVSYIQ